MIFKRTSLRIFFILRNYSLQIKFPHFTNNLSDLILFILNLMSELKFVTIFSEQCSVNIMFFFQIKGNPLEK